MLRGHKCLLEEIVAEQSRNERLAFFSSEPLASPSLRHPPRGPCQCASVTLTADIHKPQLLFLSAGPGSARKNC